MINLSSERNAQRIRLTLFVTVLAVLCLGSYWLLRVIQQEDDVRQVSPTSPDYYVEDFRYVHMNDQGQPRYLFTGTKMVHTPASQSADITLPSVISLEDKQQFMSLKAQRGVALDDQSELHLYGDVRADRIAADAGSTIRVRSEYLLFQPNDNIVRTDELVHISTDVSDVTSKGMIGNNALQELRLLNNVRGVYQKDRELPSGTKE